MGGAAWAAQLADVAPSETSVHTLVANVAVLQVPGAAVDGCEMQADYLPVGFQKLASGCPDSFIGAATE